MKGKMTIKVIALVMCLGIVVSQSPCFAEKGKANAYKDKELKEIPGRSVKQFKELLEAKKELLVGKGIEDNVEMPEKGFEIIKYPDKDIGSDLVRGLAPKTGLEKPIARIIELPREPLIPKKEYEKGDADVYRNKGLGEIPDFVEKEIGDNIEIPEKDFEIIKYPYGDIGDGPVVGLAPKIDLEKPLREVIGLPGELPIPKKEAEKDHADPTLPFTIDPSEIDGYPEYNYKDGRLVMLIVYSQPHLPEPGEPFNKAEMWYEDARLVQTIVYHDPKPYMVNFFSSDPEASRNTGCTLAVTAKITETPAQSEVETEKLELDEGRLKSIANRIQKNRASMLQFINGKDEDIE
ncbi:MAG: hypothetical protein ISS92_05805 [Candidatus Omnitrophica bacterium]|nr:hypothetical protein [Candidatus Omnitrophota bacterium]